jgi:FixJ family two-component response regulator
MMDTEPATIFVVDDDEAVRTSLQRLLRSAGLRVQVFSSAQEFLDRTSFTGNGCVVLDVQMPGIDGPALQNRLVDEGVDLPIIFLSAHGDLAIGVNAMKKGALDFLSKPVDEELLLDAIRAALNSHSAHRTQQVEEGEILARLALISPREREVMDCVVRGRLNKQIAGDLSIAEKTVKVHRARVMKKMGVRSVAQLVHLCETAARSNAQWQQAWFGKA